jgi:hypothetical protein
MLEQSKDPWVICLTRPPFEGMPNKFMVATFTSQSGIGIRSSGYGWPLCGL